MTESGGEGRLSGGGDILAEILSLGSNCLDAETREAHFEDERIASGKTPEIRESISGLSL